MIDTPKQNCGPFPASSYVRQPAQHHTQTAPGPPAPTTSQLAVGKQDRLLYALVDTTTHHRRGRGGSKRELGYSEDAGRWAV